MNRIQNMIMNTRARITRWGKLLIIFASSILCLGIGSTLALAAVDTTGNNFTMIDPAGSLVGGTNDVHFTWDGTQLTSVAVSGQVSNATLSSVTPFFAVSWTAHDVAIYGPGSYTVYAGCASGSPGCGTGTAIAFTVGAGELGAHMLFNWGASTDIDVVDIWTPNAAFGPSSMWTGAGGSNPADKVWDWMSKDWDGDGKNGKGMVDGPFPDFNANFNVSTGSGVDLCVGVVCDDSNACTTDTCNPATGQCVFTAITCNDSNVCTDDSCNPATGACVYTNNTASCDDGDSCTTDICADGVCSGTHIPNCCSPTVDTFNNNFTMIDPNNAIVGGTNDVHFTWDGTKKTSVAVSGQVSNATISSVTPFFGNLWSAHDVAIYGPGTYTVYTKCPAGSPGCGDTSDPSYPPITFTVAEGELGAHMLFNWATNADIDVVDIWKPNSVFSPSPMYTGAGGSNPTSKIWDWMSKDSNGDGINGLPMVDGPFMGFNANFNVMGILGCNEPPTEPSLVSPADKSIGLDTTVEFRWMRSTDPDGDTVSYLITYCTNSSFTNCTPVTVASRNSKGLFYAGGAGLLVFGLTFIGGPNGRRRLLLLLVIIILFAGGTLMSCKNSKVASGRDLPIDQKSYTATGLSAGTTYYWKVVADDGKTKGQTSSPKSGSWSFTTK